MTTVAQLTAPGKGQWWQVMIMLTLMMHAQVWMHDEGDGGEGGGRWRRRWRRRGWGAGDWSNLEFKNIELNKVDDVKKEIESKKDNLKNNFSDDDVKKIFLDSLNNWRKKNLKNLTENIYQEFIKETLKDKLK